MELTGKTAIITGSSAGVGRAIAVEFAKQGANIVCCARRENKLRETVEIIKQNGGNAVYVVADVTRKEQVNAVIDAAIENFGQIDILYNNAAAFAAIGALWEVDMDVWWNDVTVNILGPALLSRAVLPHMMKRNSGLIINMDGGGSAGPFPGATGYGCSKAALMRLTDTLARELEHDGYDIYVVAMAPGSVYTEIWEPQLNTPGGKKWIGELRAIVDEKRYMPPELCAQESVKLVKIVCPEINGRMFGVGTDFDEVARNARQIQANDTHQIRMKK